MPESRFALATDRLILRLPEISDIPAILSFFQENAAHFAPTDPPMPPDFVTEEFWAARIPKIHEARAAEQSLNLHLFFPGAHELVGTANFSQMFRGPFQACFLGYKIARRHEGQGLMSEALRRAIGYLFDDLNFHRVMANHLPENARSAALLQRLGFEREGLARNYLLINGRWRDHVLNSLVNENWRPDA
jgi:[ribosomal protein S5]-alanine N-acetyltransferase